MDSTEKTSEMRPNESVTKMKIRVLLFYAIVLVIDCYWCVFGGTWNDIGSIEGFCYRVRVY
jgi:hypothetical protein